MTKSPLAITAPLIHLSINSLTKPCLYDTIISIENKVIYFGPNWKLPFSALSPRSISQVEDILDDYDNNRGRLSSGRKDITLMFESNDFSKVFECDFHNFSVFKKDLINFLHQFLKRYDKWEQKQNKKMTSIEEDYISKKNSKASTRAGSSNLSGRSSRFFAGNSRNCNDSDHMTHNHSRSMVKTVKSAPKKYKSNLDKLKDKMLRKLKENESYWSEDETSLESKIQSRGGDQVLESDSQMDHQDRSEENVISKRNRPEKSVKQRKKLKKMGERKAIEDDDSDIDFGENDIAPQFKQGQHFKDDDDDDEEDYGRGEMDDSRLNTDLTRGTTKVANITPLRNQNIMPLIDHKTADDVVTDEEVSSDSHSSPKTEAPKSGILSFFNSSKSVKRSKLPLDGTVAKSSKYSTAEKHKRSFHQHLSPLKTHGLQNSSALSPHRTRHSSSPNPKWEQRKTIKCDTPQKVYVGSPKPKAVTFRPRSLSPFKRSPIKNPSQKSTPPRSEEISHLGLQKSPQKVDVGSPKLKTVAFRPRSSSPSKISPIKNPYQKSTPPRSEEISHLGLKNLGNTCYINSSLQILFSLPHFVERLDVIYKRLKSAQANDKETMPLCSAILTVASALRLFPSLAQNVSTIEGSANPSVLKKELDVLTDKFAGYEQRDAHEFLSDLIDLLHDELLVAARVNNFGEDFELPTDEFFRLTVNVTLTCNCCNYSRSKQEMYRHLSIDIGTNRSNQDEPWTIHQGIDNFFKPEVRDIKCEKCKEGTSVTQTIAVTSRPKALLLHLKRFRMEAKDGQVIIRKSSGRVKSGQSVSLGTFMDNGDNAKNCSYELKGVVRHIGSSSLSGHYTADALRKNLKDGNQEWVNFDDGSTSITSLYDVLESEGSQSNNYLMLYSLE
jgi:Ubiquitin C-terminal hydrolase